MSIKMILITEDTRLYFEISRLKSPVKRVYHSDQELRFSTLFVFILFPQPCLYYRSCLCTSNDEEDGCLILV